MRVPVIWMLIGLLALAACAAPTTFPRREGTSTDTPVISQAEPEGQTPSKLREAMGEAVIIYQRSGGLAGVFEQWTIFPDGRITASDGREWQVKPEQVEQLLGDVEGLGFFEMRGRYMPLDTCCDRFTYSITVRSGSKVNTVTTIDAAPDVPANLWKVLGAVQGLINSAQKEN